MDEVGKPLDYQLDTWKPSGESLFWVRLPTLKSGVAFYVRWGDSEPNVDSARSAATWNENYAGVWHMGEASGVCRNSTRHGAAHDAMPKENTDQSVLYAGSDAPVGGARTTATNKKSYLQVPGPDEKGPAGVFGDGVFTISGWVRCEAGSGHFRLFSRKTGWSGTGWEVESNNGSMTKLTARGDFSNKDVPFELQGDGLRKTWVHIA